MCYVLKTSRGEYAKKKHDNLFVPVSSECLADTFDTYQEAEKAKRLICRAKRKEFKVYSIDDKNNTEVVVDLMSLRDGLIGNTIDWKYILQHDEELKNKQKEIEELKSKIEQLQSEKEQAIIDKESYREIVMKQYNKYESACADLYHIPEIYNLNAVQYCRWGKLVRHFRKDHRRPIKNELRRLDTIKEGKVNIEELKSTIEHQENPYYRFRFFGNNGEDLVHAIKTGEGLAQFLEM